MMSIIGCFYEHTHTHNKGLGREYMGHAKITAVKQKSWISYTYNCLQEQGIGGIGNRESGIGNWE